MVESVTQNLASAGHEVFQPFEVSTCLTQAGDDESDLAVGDMPFRAVGASEDECLFVEPDATRGVDVMVDDGAVEHRHGLQLAAGLASSVVGQFPISFAHRQMVVHAINVLKTIV
jgi:hypothetical protein